MKRHRQIKTVLLLIGFIVANGHFAEAQQLAPYFLATLCDGYVQKYLDPIDQRVQRKRTLRRRNTRAGRPL
jgi:hypothetical protein